MIRFLLGISIIIIAAGASDADARLIDLFFPSLLGMALFVSGGVSLIKGYDQ
jgi:hypothetical protein